MTRLGNVSILIALVLCTNTQCVISFAPTSRGYRQGNIGKIVPISSKTFTSSRIESTQLLAASVPIATKKNFVCNLVSRLRELTSGVLVTNKIVALGAVIISAVFIILREVLWKPSRTYDRDANSVGREYDAWTTEGILEEYWGEHIHLGYYSPEEMAAGYKKKNFIQAKYDFVDQMMEFGKASSLTQPITVLDVGCGIGGS